MQKHGKIEKLIRIEKEINNLKAKKESEWKKVKYMLLYLSMAVTTAIVIFLYPLFEWYTEMTLQISSLREICFYSFMFMILLALSHLFALCFSKTSQLYNKKEIIINRKLKKLRKEAKLTIESLEITDVIIEKEMLLKSKYRNNLMIINALKSVELKNNLNKAYWNAYNLIEEKYKSLGFWSETVNKKTFDDMKKDFLNKGLTLDQLEERIELMETKVNLNKKNLIVY